MKKLINPAAMHPALRFVIVLILRIPCHILENFILPKRQSLERQWACIIKDKLKAREYRDAKPA